MALGWGVRVLNTSGQRGTRDFVSSVSVPTRADFIRSYVRMPGYPVLVTASDTRRLGYPLLAVLLGHWRHRRVIVNVLSGRFGVEAANWSVVDSACHRIALRLADAVLVCNSDLQASVARLGVPRSRVRFAGCSLPPAEARPEASSLIGEFVKAHKPVLLSVGSLRPLYRLPLAVRTLERLRGTHPEVGLIVVTSGDEDADEGSRFLAAVKEVGEDRVALLREVEHTSLLRLMEQCDVFLRLTTHDGDSVSLHEGIASGLPCVVSDTGTRPAGTLVVTSVTPEGVSTVVSEALLRARGSGSTERRLAERNMRTIVQVLCGGKA
jgi:glycosyltransferase involved in cell wall biosynthesis